MHPGILFDYRHQIAVFQYKSALSTMLFLSFLEPCPGFWAEVDA
jgi:hypothetical protein